MRSCALDRIHDAAALEQLIEPDAAENLLRSLLEEAGEKIARKKNYKRADERRYVLVQLRKTLLKPVAET
jgi:hypothetical protein